jgi:hypothetical protein
VTTRTPPQTITASVQAGLPTIYTIHLSAARSIQVYLDPGKVGVLNEFHHTYLGPDGNELKIDQASVVAVTLGLPTAKEGAGKGLVQSNSMTLTTRQLDPLGHFVSDFPPSPPGRYRFNIDATTADGAAITAHIDIDVR